MARPIRPVPGPDPSGASGPFRPARLARPSARRPGGPPSSASESVHAARPAGPGASGASGPAGLACPARLSTHCHVPTGDGAGIGRSRLGFQVIREIMASLHRHCPSHPSPGRRNSRLRVITSPHPSHHFPASESSRLRSRGLAFPSESSTPLSPSSPLVSDSRLFVSESRRFKLLPYESAGRLAGYYAALVTSELRGITSQHPSRHVP